jgi:hypothetical protein
MTRRKQKADPFAKLLTGAQLCKRADYKPVVGYLYTDGSVERFSSEQHAWFSMERALSTCFASAAKRVKGTHDHMRGEIASILMVIVDGSGKPVWRHRIDLPLGFLDSQTGGPNA